LTAHRAAIAAVDSTAVAAVDSAAIAAVDSATVAAVHGAAAAAPCHGATHARHGAEATDPTRTIIASPTTGHRKTEASAEQEDSADIPHST
jgi:hypothetical protein